MRSCIILAIVLTGLTLVPSLATTGGGPAGVDRQAALQAVFEEYREFQHRRNPEQATAVGDHRYDDKVFNYAPDAWRDEAVALQAIRRHWAEVPRCGLDRTDRLRAAVFGAMIEHRLQALERLEPLAPLDARPGFVGHLRTLQDHHPFNTPQDCDNYAARMRGVRKQVRDMIRAMESGLQLGVVSSELTVRQNLAALHELLSDDPLASSLAAPAARIGEAAGGRASRYVVEDGVRDADRALRRLASYLESRYLPALQGGQVGHPTNGVAAPPWALTVPSFDAEAGLGAPEAQAARELGVIGTLDRAFDPGPPSVAESADR